MALQCPALLALGNISEDFVLQLVCCAVGDPAGREELIRATRNPQHRSSAVFPTQQQAVLTA